MSKDPSADAAVFGRKTNDPALPDLATASGLSVLPSTGWPRKISARKQVHVEMRNRFSGIFAMIDHEPKTLRARRDPELSGNLTGGEKHRTEGGLIRGFGLTKTRNDLPWNDEHVDRSLRLDVVERNAVLVLMHERRRNLAVDDLLENGLL